MPLIDMAFMERALGYAAFGVAPTPTEVTLDDGDPHYVESNETFSVLDEEWDTL